VDTHLTLISPSSATTTIWDSFCYLTFANSCALNRLAPLELSCLSFPSSFRLFSMLCSLFSQNTRGGVCSTPQSRIKMTPKSSSSDFTPERCQYRTATGRQCCSVAVDPDSSFCARHAASEPADSEDFSVPLTERACRFQNAQGINHSLGALYTLAARDVSRLAGLAFSPTSAACFSAR